MSDNLIAMLGTTVFFIALLLWIPFLESSCSVCRKVSSALRGTRSAKASNAEPAGEFVTSAQKQS